MNVATPTERHEEIDAVRCPNRKNVLVIEDQPRYAGFIEDVFTDAGYRVRVAHNAEEALSLVSNDPPSLITLDLIMPGKTGIKLYRDLCKRKDLVHTRVIILTGLDHDSEGMCSYREFFERIARRGNIRKPDAYLTKPIEAEELLASARRVLAA